MSINNNNHQNSEASNKQRKKRKRSKMHRDFATDLRSYIESWRNRNTEGTWKFNKVLQTWALDNILSCDKINKPLFKLTCEYVMSVQGAARERLLQEMKVALDTYAPVTEGVATEDGCNKLKDLLVESEGQEGVKKEGQIGPILNPRIAYKRAMIVTAILS